MGCLVCGVIAHSHGRRDVVLVGAPCFDRPVQLVWRKRTWRCEESSCPRRVFTKQDLEVAAPRALLTTRACWWAINQIRREHASIRGLARQLGCSWKTLWRAVEPVLRLPLMMRPGSPGSLPWVWTSISGTTSASGRSLTAAVAPNSSLGCSTSPRTRTARPGPGCWTWSRPVR